MAQSSLAQGDEHFSDKCQVLNNKLEMLVQILEQESGEPGKKKDNDDEDDEDDDSEKSAREKQEKDINNLREKTVSLFKHLIIPGCYSSRKIKFSFYQ